MGADEKIKILAFTKDYILSGAEKFHVGKLTTTPPPPPLVLKSMLLDLPTHRLGPVDTMMKFASFETTVELIYKYLPGKKSDYGNAGQTAVSFAGGYIAGILCAIISHPADVCRSLYFLPPSPVDAPG